MKEVFQSYIDNFTRPINNQILGFSLILLIILIAPLILRKLRMPGIIGLIISGMIIGPNFLNIIEKNSAIDLFSTIGLLYIMFIAGIDLNLNEFSKNKNKSIAFGILTFLLPLAIGFPVCHFVLGLNKTASLLVALMFSTHTLVSYPIVSKMGVSKNPAVALTVGGTIFTDTLVLLIFAIIISSVNGEFNPNFLLKLGISISVFIFILFFVIPHIARWFFSRLESEKYSHYIFVLSVVFFSAFIAQISGLEPIIGAFMAGLSLNRILSKSPILLNRIEFIGNSIFIPFFLIAVGMIIDIKSIYNNWSALYIAGVLTVVAIFTKWTAAFFTQKIFRLSVVQRNLIFGLSTSHAVATLAIILVGYNSKIISIEILDGTIILILITCIVSSMVSEKTSKKIITKENITDINFDNKISDKDSTILIPVHNLQNIHKHLILATELKFRKKDKFLYFLYVVENDENAEKNISIYKERILDKLSESNFDNYPTEVLTTIDQNSAGGISRTAIEISADIILMGKLKRANVFERLLVEKFEMSINSSYKTIIFTICENPISQIRRICLILPEFALKEKYYHKWLKLICNLSVSLNIPIKIYGNEDSEFDFDDYVHKYGKFINWDYDYITINEEEVLKSIANKIKVNDLLVFPASRRDFVSYHNFMYDYPEKIEKYFTGFDKLIIYPEQRNSSQSIQYFDKLSDSNIIIE